MKAYMVYTDYEEDRILPEEVEFFKELGDALARANEMKEELQHSEEWEIGDEYDAEELTDADNDILFTHKRTGLESYVCIHSFVLKEEKSDEIGDN